MNVIRLLVVWALAGWLAYNLYAAMKRKVIRLRGGVLIAHHRWPVYFSSILLVWVAMILGLTLVGVVLLYR